MSQMSVVWMCVAMCVCWSVVGVCALAVNRWHLQRSNMFDIHWRAKHVAKWLTFCRLHNSNSNSNRRQQQQSQQPTATVPPPTSSAANSNRQLATGNRQQAGKSNSVHQLIALVANRLADANIVGNTMPCATSATCAAQTGKRTDWQFCSAAFRIYFDIFFTFMFMDSNSNCWLIADNRQVLLLLLSLLLLPLI